MNLEREYKVVDDGEVVAVMKWANQYDEFDTSLKEYMVECDMLNGWTYLFYSLKDAMEWIQNIDFKRSGKS